MRPPMDLTRSFKDTAKARFASDAAFRVALSAEAIECLLSGDIATGKALLRDFINPATGFENPGI